ncbi:MAG: HAD family phosphatase [Elusimicrobiota bacterium]|jgi:HAD superfamily hydrolase (TIGR01509 family)
MKGITSSQGSGKRRANGAAVRAVFFDIGNVLLHFDARQVQKRFVAAVGLRPKSVRELLWAGRLVDGVERGRITSARLYRVFREELSYRGTFEEFRRLWCDMFTLDRGAQRLLARLARRGVPVYLLSNTNRLHYDHILERYDFPRLVRGAVLSYRLGLRKPEVGIYRAAVRRARVRPEEALFIDDLPKNVAGARRVGLRACRYRGARDLERRLRVLGLL